MAKKTESVEEFKSVSGGDFFQRLADWMRENGVNNPREVPDTIVESLRGAN